MASPTVFAYDELSSPVDENGSGHGLCQRPELRLALLQGLLRMSGLVVQPGVLERDGGMAGQRLEEIDVALDVRLPVAFFTERKDPRELPFGEEGDDDLSALFSHPRVQRSELLFRQFPLKLFPDHYFPSLRDPFDDASVHDAFPGRSNGSPVSLLPVMAVFFLQEEAHVLDTEASLDAVDKKEQHLVQVKDGENGRDRFLQDLLVVVLVLQDRSLNSRLDLPADRRAEKNEPDEAERGGNGEGGSEGRFQELEQPHLDHGKKCGEQAERQDTRSDAPDVEEAIAGHRMEREDDPGKAEIRAEAGFETESAEQLQDAGHERSPDREDQHAVGEVIQLRPSNAAYVPSEAVDLEHQPEELEYPHDPERLREQAGAVDVGDQGVIAALDQIGRYAQAQDDEPEGIEDRACNARGPALFILQVEDDLERRRYHQPADPICAGKGGDVPAKGGQNVHERGDEGERGGKEGKRCYGSLRPASARIVNEEKDTQDDLDQRDKKKRVADYGKKVHPHV